jgi:hypothetical protein
MMRDWFSPQPRKVKPGWQYRIAFMAIGVIGTLVMTYLFVGRAMFSIGGLVALGIVVIDCIVVLVLLHLLDPILRARLRTRFRS